MSHRPTIRLRLLALALLAGAPLAADWRDDTGYVRLHQTFVDVPTAPAAGVAIIEAGNDSGNNYLPASGNTAFSGKTIINKSTGSGTSAHATTVGTFFFGNSSLIPDTASIDAYHAGGWQVAEFLNLSTSDLPLVETRAVQNHSWIGRYNREQTPENIISNSVTNIGRRLDYAINRDGFTSVVGMNNGSTSAFPDLLCQTYHTLSVGLVNGNHSSGVTAFDGANRMKPDIVAYQTQTSYASPQVAGAASLLSEKLRTNSYSPALATADYPRLTKALLLAGAIKEPLPSWTRTSSATP